MERSARRLARATFHGMLIFRAGMERRQAFLFRTVDIAMELFAMAAATTHAARLADGRYPEAEAAASWPTSSAGTRGARCGGSSATCGATTMR